MITKTLMRIFKKRYLLISAVSLFIIFLFAVPFRHTIKNRIIFYYGIIKSKVKGTGMAKCQDCDTLFRDGIAEHKKAYQNEGIIEQESDERLLNLKQRGILKKIESNEFYIVRNFKHSKPILLPKAVLFLNRLTEVYHQKCLDSKKNYVPFEITSATRSKKSIRELQENNSNAIENSPHLRGKTFDVSYAGFTENNTQLKLFISSLSELKNKNKCFVKYERNGCLHITVN